MTPDPVGSEMGSSSRAWSAGGRRDLAAEVRDLQASERDEGARGRDGIAGVRDTGAEERDGVTTDRDVAGQGRDEDADRRDHVGQDRDSAAKARDDAAEQRDRLARAPTTWPEHVARVVFTRRAAASDREFARQDRLAGAHARADAEADRGSSRRDRLHSSDDRGAAGLDRAASSRDRGAGATQRVSSVEDRRGAHFDRDMAANDRWSSSLDDLTGAYLRRPGLLELNRDMDRARRDHKPLVVAFVDVDRLKAVNDQNGHAAGDQLLRRVVHVLQGQLRPHDLIIRVGGDEFVCEITGLPVAEVAGRLDAVNAVLASGPVPGSVTVGLAQLGPGETATELIARADRELYLQRIKRSSSNG